MDSCQHDEACHTFIGDSWGYLCPEPPHGSGCGLSTKESHHNAESAKGEWERLVRPAMDEAAIQRRCAAIRAKQAAGEKLAHREEVILAYAPVELGGTAASCPSSVVFTRSLLLGST